MNGESQILKDISNMLETVIGWKMKDEKVEFLRGYNDGAYGALEQLMYSEILNLCIKEELI